MIVSHPDQITLAPSFNPTCLARYICTKLLLFLSIITNMHKITSAQHQIFHFLLSHRSVHSIYSTFPLTQSPHLTSLTLTCRHCTHVHEAALRADSFPGREGHLHVLSRGHSPAARRVLFREHSLGDLIGVRRRARREQHPLAPGHPLHHSLLVHLLVPSCGDE